MQPIMESIIITDSVLIFNFADEKSVEISRSDILGGNIVMVYSRDDEGEWKNIVKLILFTKDMYTYISISKNQKEVIDTLFYKKWVDEVIIIANKEQINDNRQYAEINSYLNA